MKKLACSIFLFAATTAMAEPAVQAVDLRDHHLAGEVTRILAPSLIELTTKVDGYDVIYWVEPAFIAWGDVKDKDCESQQPGAWSNIKSTVTKDMPPDQLERQSKRIIDGCEALSYMVGDDVEIEVVKWSDPAHKQNTVLLANVFHEGMSVGYKLVADGRYPVDATQTRDYSIVGEQKQPDCIKHMESQGLEKFERTNLTCMRFVR